ncbi:hybrid sensor histidine kinase/response regulator transcription factor [Psychroserpens damuponensis]|uniref:hybrid sensor histidine kinase/response regulator transcription factor n=1 Tax=Psychroserpens damuponensis TaxID=943936 RepID=UPI000693AA4A|nr:tetratricopeptide repeat protein [Psychroserpens damuponensis]
MLDSLKVYPKASVERVNLLNKLAYYNWNKNPKKTDSLGEISLRLSNEINYKNGICESYYNLALGQWMLGNYPLAHEYANSSLKVAENNNQPSDVLRAYSILALIYDDQGLLNNALNYHELVLKKRIESLDSSAIATSLNNMGSVYFKMDSLEKSVELFRESYTIRKKINSKRGMRESLSNIAYVLNEQGKPKEAMPLIKRSLKIAEELNDINGIVNLGSTLGTVYINLKQLDSAEQILLKTLPLAEKIGVNKRIVEIKGFLGDVYQAKKDYKSANKYLNEYWVLKDSIEGQEATNKILELQTKYETEKKEKEIFELQQQNEESENWRNIFGLGTLTMILIAAFIYLFYRYRQLNNLKLIEAKNIQTEQLKDINKMKSKFLANISHEFRTPLTLIIGPAKELLANTKEEETKQQLNWIHKNSQKLLKLINQLLELSKLEAGKEKLKTSQDDIVSFTKHIFNLFESLAIQKHLKTSFKSKKEQIYVYFDSEKLEQVITNLLSNAFKFTDKGEVSVTLNEVTIKNNDYCKITIQDSGKGIHEQQLPYVFDRFYQANQDGEDSYEGTGIGLSLSKELIELHSGKIEAESELNKGTTFHLLIPLGKAHLKEEQIIPSIEHTFSNEIPQGINSTENDTGDTHEGTLPLVLIVDDNRDIVDYIQVSLNGRYRFLKAFDGNQGLELSENELPDLIISDVMMPGLNGLQLCEKVKTNVKTDHIPVILLTAKAGENDKLDGLEAKADEYLQKPFNKKELQVRVHNLIENRKRLRKRFTNKVIFKPSEVAENSQEELFLDNLKEIVENNHTDSQFDVKRFCELIHMSKSQLNRKMKAVFNKSPNQFIRSYRLEKAKYLIAQDRGFSLSEIAYEVGFASPAYFSKCFNDEFGYAPSELKN